MPSEPGKVLILRLIEIGKNVLSAINEDADAETLLSALHDHRCAMQDLKKLDMLEENNSTAVDENALDIESVQKLNLQVKQITQAVRRRRDDVARQLLHSRNKKRAFDAYQKI